jgi:hypothetical protein
MAEPTTHHRVYLLTVWWEPDQHGNPECWRFRLEDPRSGQSRSFANAAALVSALMRGDNGQETADEGSTQGGET